MSQSTPPSKPSSEKPAGPPRPDRPSRAPKPFGSALAPKPLGGKPFGKPASALAPNAPSKPSPAASSATSATSLPATKLPPVPPPPPSSRRPGSASPPLPPPSSPHHLPPPSSPRHLPPPSSSGLPPPSRRGGAKPHPPTPPPPPSARRAAPARPPAKPVTVEVEPEPIEEAEEIDEIVEDDDATGTTEAATAAAVPASEGDDDAEDDDAEDDDAEDDDAEDDDAEDDDAEDDDAEDDDAEDDDAEDDDDLAPTREATTTSAAATPEPAASEATSAPTDEAQPNQAAGLAPLPAMPPTPALPPNVVAGSVSPRLEPPLPSVPRSVPPPPVSPRPLSVAPPSSDGAARYEETDGRRLPPVSLPAVPAPPPSAEEIARSGGLLGTTLAERYRVDRLLAEGAMGQVFVGEHVMMKKKVAIKVLKRSLTRVPEVVARFEREARAAANIEHQNVVAATDFGKTDDDAVFIVLEYVEGTSLREVLADGPVPLARALNIGRQIAAALAAAHALDIVHRDLKPENVMVLKRANDEDLVKVLDFGIAKVPEPDESAEDEESHSITNPGMVFGTPEYMSPEQGLGQEVDARADVYSLGVIVFEMLAGKLPFDSEEGILGQQLKGKVPRIQERNPDVVVPTHVNSFVASMMTSEVADRVQGAKEALRGFDALIAEFGDDSAVRSPAQSSPGRSFQDSVAELNVKAEALVERLPESVRHLPPAVLVGVPVALLLLVVVLLASGGSEEQAPEATAEPSAKAVASVADAPKAKKEMADDEELSVAKAAGLTVLDELAAKYPKDAKVHVAYARMLSKEQKHTKAVDEVQIALELDPETTEDGQVATVLWAGAQSKARKTTFELLQGKMGAKGADILYDLATVKGVRSSTQSMAQKHLETRGFAQAATPQASIAADLFTAKSCQIRKGLLKRAENVGDFRSLELLEKFSAGEGCKEDESGECNECLRGSDELATAKKALEGRAKSKKAEPTGDDE